MNNKNIGKIIKICGSHSLLVSFHGNGLRRVYCPFPVTCIATIGDIYPGEQVHVERISLSENLRLQYVILDKPYPYQCFNILDKS